MPPSEMTAVSVVPPPMSMTMLPTGSSIGQAGADGGRHRLLDELRVGRAGPPGRLGDGAPLDLGDGRRHADQHAGPVEPGHADALQQQPDHALGDVEVGDGAAAQRPHGDDVAGRAADHLPGLVAHGQHLAALAVEGDDRRLVQHDAPALGVHQGVGGAEVDGQVASQGLLLALRRPAVDLVDRADGSSAAAAAVEPSGPIGPSAAIVATVGRQRPHLPLERLDAAVLALGLARPQRARPRAEDDEAEHHQQEDQALHQRPTVGDVAAARRAPSPAPSAHVSRFQIGTVAFSVSMPKRAASNASPRWGADTATTTDDVPELETAGAVEQRDAPDRRASAARISAGDGVEPGHDLLLVRLVGEVGHAGPTLGVVAHGAARTAPRHRNRDGPPSRTHRRPATAPS